MRNNDYLSWAFSELLCVAMSFWVKRKVHHLRIHKWIREKIKFSANEINRNKSIREHLSRRLKKKDPTAKALLKLSEESWVVNYFDKYLWWFRFCVLFLCVNNYPYVNHNLKKMRVNPSTFFLHNINFLCSHSTKHTHTNTSNICSVSTALFAESL